MKHIVFFVILTFSFQTYSQTLKYKDVFEKIKLGKREEIFQLLKLFAKKDTNLSSVNMQIGLYFYDKCIAADPLKEFELLKRNADSASFYLSRSLRQITEKEVKKNDEYYYNYFSTPNITQNRDTVLVRIKNDLSSKKKFILNHKKSVSMIFFHFSKGAEFYQQASIIYKKLNEEHKNENELCLLADDKKLNELKNLSSIFDSVLFHENEYKKLINGYPLKNYNQTFEVRNIETFRIDGFSKSDFLANKVQLWNYSEWAKKVVWNIENEIEEIKKKSTSSFYRNKALFQKIQAQNLIEDTLNNLKLDVKLFRLLNKYNFNSITQKLLDYQQKKIIFSGFSISPNNKLENTNLNNIEAKAELMFLQKRRIAICDSALQKLKLSNFSNEYKLNEKFINQEFATQKDLENKLTNDQFFINQNISSTKSNYKTLIYNYVEKSFKNDSYISYNGMQIPKFITGNDVEKPIKVFGMVEDKSENILICGQTSDSKNFVAKISNSNQILWFKTINIKQVGNSFEFPSCIETTDENVTIAINSKINNQIKNTIVKFDKTGIEIFSKPFNTNAIIRKMVIDEFSDTYYFASKGTEIDENFQQDEAINITNFDNLGINRWTQSVNIKGVVADFVKIYEGFLLACNYSQIGNTSNLIKSQAGETPEKTNVLLMKFTPQGQVKKHETLNQNQAYYANKIVKINSGIINIVGYQGDLSNQWTKYENNSSKEKILKIVNSNLDLVDF